MTDVLHSTDGRPARLLTVCLGNICRSPAAEAALREAAAELGLPLEVDSAGTGDWHLGEPPNERMREAAADAGLALTGRARQVDAELLAWADLVLVMDRRNLADVQELAARSSVTTPITLFRTFDPELAQHGPDDLVPGPDRLYARDEVPDPYTGERDDFDEVVRLVRRTAREIVVRWPEAVSATGEDAR
jgi:protein-tyrosine phosphatase